LIKNDVVDYFNFRKR